MPEVNLVAETGRSPGSRPSRRLRRAGKIPAVVYGHGRDPVSVAVPYRDLRAALTTEAGMNALIDLDVAGTRQLTIVRDVQRDPVRNDITHVDLLVVHRDEVITVDVPVVVEGEARQVTQDNGNVDQQLHALAVSATPGNIPNEIRVDISGLTIGDAIRVGDLSLPAGAATEVDDDVPVVLAQVSRAAVEAEELAGVIEEGGGDEAEEPSPGGARETPGP
ncbi:MAG: 50S ribosomal protein L25 [Acidimicrobiales bacterium]